MFDNGFLAGTARGPCVVRRTTASMRPTKASSSASAHTVIGIIFVCFAFGAEVTHARSLQQQDSAWTQREAIAAEIASVLDSLFDVGEPAERATAPDSLEIRAVLNSLLDPSTPAPVPARNYALYGDTECVTLVVVRVRQGVGSVQDCQAECDAAAGCNAFTFNPNTQTCYLTPNCRERAREPGMISGVEESLVGLPFVRESDDEADVPQYVPGQTFNLYEDTGCADGLIDTVEAVETEPQCRLLCIARPSCNSYTLNPKKRRCFLAVTCESRETEEGNISGVDAAVDPMTMEFNLYEGTACDGDTIIHKGGYGSVAECQAWCQQRTDCGAFTYNMERERCYLKHDCDDRKTEEEDVSGVRLAADECTVSPPCATDDPDKVCPARTETRGELADPVYGTFEPPYEGIRHRPTYDKRDEYPTCNFQPPRDPLPKDWVDQCIENAREVGFLRERKGRPNEACPAGWFLCKGMCYTLVQRNSRAPDCGVDCGGGNGGKLSDYYIDDFMFVESRCGLCGGARVAFVGDDDPDMQRVVTEAAKQTLNEDEATWVRRFRFLKERNERVARRDPYQPWHLYITLHKDGKERKPFATYQRWYTGEKDDLDKASWDVNNRNQEGSILCVNTIQRIQQAVKHSDDSNLTMEKGCRGKNKKDMWDNDEHRWRPELHYPFPGH